MLPASPDKTCVLPDWWCNDEGEVLAKSDCGDGDGVDDWACVNPATGQRKWCTDPGYVRQRLDCGDGDAADDWVCTRPSSGERGVLLSSSDCTEDHWPDAAEALCPPLFNRE
eukprot:XP_001698770.1 predicted protein [Chlamydomonas reinhardtii]